MKKMSANNVNGLLGVSMDKIKEMVDVNTVVGEPITTPDGTTVIPISRVNYGFAAGGSDLPSKSQPQGGLFAGGSGAKDFGSVPNLLLGLLVLTGRG
jgi:sporulation protein YtfJ